VKRANIGAGWTAGDQLSRPAQGGMPTSV